MDAALQGHPYVKSAIDMACWDILGKATGQPVCVLLGGRYGDDFVLYRAISQESPEAWPARGRLSRRGLSAVPAQGRRRPVVDIDRIRAVAAELKPGDRLVADANTGWLMHDALRVVRAVRDVDVYIEQPCRSYEECLTIRRHCDHPFVLDEVIDSLDALLRGHADRAMDVVNIKISKLGGLTKARQVRDLCVSLGIAMTIEDSWGGDITTAAIAHLAHSTPPEFLVHVHRLQQLRDRQHRPGCAPSGSTAGCRPRSPQVWESSRGWTFWGAGGRRRDQEGRLCGHGCPPDSRGAYLMNVCSDGGRSRDRCPLPSSLGEKEDPSRLTVDRIFGTHEFEPEPCPFVGSRTVPTYTTLEPSNEVPPAAGLRSPQPGKWQAPGLGFSAARLIPINESSPLGHRRLFTLARSVPAAGFHQFKARLAGEHAGDYWVLDRSSHELRKLGGDAPASSLMHAKFARGMQVAYVRANNLYVEDLLDGRSPS